MAATRVISVVGKKDAGKTSLVVALAAEFVKRGRRVATIKHGTHPADVDKPGTDTYRQYHEGMAGQGLLGVPRGGGVFERTTGEAAAPTPVRGHPRGGGTGRVAGHTRSPRATSEVHRRSLHHAPLFDAASPEAALWIAMVTDDDTLRLPMPVFRFSDTGWFVALAQLAWEHAMVIGD